MFRCSALSLASCCSQQLLTKALFVKTLHFDACAFVFSQIYHILCLKKQRKGRANIYNDDINYSDCDSNGNGNDNVPMIMKMKEVIRITVKELFRITGSIPESMYRKKYTERNIANYIKILTVYG